MLYHDIIPYSKPVEMLAWYAKNPLLLEVHPALCARRAAELEAGLLSNYQCSTIAQGMSKERLQLRLKLTNNYEGALADQPHWQRIQELLQSGQIESRERSTVRAFAMQCHEREWPWLIARLEEVITRRALAEGYEFATAA